MAEAADKRLEPVEKKLNPEAETPAGEDPRDKREYNFPFSFVDGKDHDWSGRFQSTILDIGKRQAVAILEASFNGAMPYSSIPPEMQLINKALAHMQYSLGKTPRPDWAKDLRKIDNPQIILGLYQEVLDHEDRFLGVEQDPGKGQEGG